MGFKEPFEDVDALVYDMTRMLEYWKEEGTDLNDGEYAELLNLIMRGKAFSKYV